MDRTQYLKDRDAISAGNLSEELLYEMYKEKRDVNKQELNVQEFMHFFQIFTQFFNQGAIVQSVINFYDKKFDIIYVYNANQQLIKVL